MKLSFEQIKQITTGAIRIEQEPDGIHFYKCTEKQIAAWTEKNKDLGMRAAGTTGVCLDFHTTSQHLAFTVSQGNKFELYINNLLRGQFLLKEEKQANITLCDALGHPLDEYRVTIVFPSHDAGGVLTSLELDDGATVTPHTYDINLLFIGDSITQGWASRYDSLSYAWRLTRHFNARAVNQGIGGAYFHEDCFDHIDFHPDVVLVAYGTNDFGRYKTYEEFRAHTAAHLRLIAEEYTEAKIFVLSPIWRDKRDGKSMGTFEGCRAIVEQEAEALDLIHIDGLDLVPPIPEFFGDAFLHPNDEGFSLYAENLIIALEKHLK